MEILINTSYGGYRLHPDAKKVIPEGGCDRTAPELIQFYKTHKESPMFRSISLVVIPDGCEYDIEEYDGWESVVPWVAVSEEELREGISENKLRLCKEVQHIRLVHGNGGR